jgi:hypothetical protein
MPKDTVLELPEVVQAHLQRIAKEKENLEMQRTLLITGFMLGANIPIAGNPVVSSDGKTLTVPAPEPA